MLFNRNSTSIPGDHFEHQLGTSHDFQSLLHGCWVLVSVQSIKQASGITWKVTESMKRTNLNCNRLMSFHCYACLGVLTFVAIEKCVPQVWYKYCKSFDWFQNFSVIEIDGPSCRCFNVDFLDFKLWCVYIGSMVHKWFAYPPRSQDVLGSLLSSRNPVWNLHSPCAYFKLMKN